MSLDTSPYRYEVMSGKSNLHGAMKAQEERIRRDEMMAAKENTVKSENDVNLKSEWKESLEDAASRRAITLNQKQAANELIMAQKAVTVVRRAALKKLLDEEIQKYECELHAQGKAFYVKRT